ncbi:AAA family ATPase [Lysinibacillus sp. FW12]|uniref:AAA family ATPase n=1 Tax=Lysinibacillus sp. FW12 TaxID=3096079 RepID=UPI003D75CDFF
MTRFCVLTIGKTHSGKSTFARSLEQMCQNCIVIDQDQQAQFLYDSYSKLIPNNGENTIKYKLTETLVQYAVDHTKFHIVLCNSNLNEFNRNRLIQRFNNSGFHIIIVKFYLPIEILESRINEARRDTSILRTVQTFKDVLNSQKDYQLKKSVEHAYKEFYVTNEIQVDSVLSELKNLLNG